MQGGLVMFGATANGVKGVMGYTPAVPAAYYPIIGRIIINWSFLEQNIDLCIPKILAVNKTRAKEWRRKATKKRIQLFQSEMELASKDFDEVSIDTKRLFLNLWSAKQIRDWLCHENISFNMGDKRGRTGIEFVSKSFGRKRKPIDIDELKAIDRKIQNCQITLHNFNKSDEVNRYSSEEKQFLSSSLGQVHLL
jgi:hypothetical protein